MVVSYLFEAGWMFFAAWSAIVATAVVAAFGEDFLPSRSSQNWASQESPTHAPTAHPGAGSLLR
jgi:hypothetical protein